jgi:hypothetical protein
MFFRNGLETFSYPRLPRKRRPTQMMYHANDTQPQVKQKTAWINFQ